MYTIQKATLDDVLSIKQLLKKTWIDTYGAFYSPEIIDEITSSWHDQKLLSKQIQNPKCYFAVAKDNHDIIGIVSTRKTDEDTLWLHRLYVDKNYQGRGIGKKLLHSALHAFPGIIIVFLEVEAMNQKAIDFYIKQGFKLHDESEEIIHGKTFKVIEMIKKLS